MRLTSDQVEKVAKLANLKIFDSDKDKYSHQLSKILDYVDQLDKANSSQTIATFNVTGKETVVREDEPSKSLTQDEALANAPKKSQGYFATKGVFDNE